MDDDYSAEQIQAAIASAIREHNMEAVAGLIALLALKDPRAAELIIATVKYSAAK